MYKARQRCIKRLTSNSTVARTALIVLKFWSRDSGFDGGELTYVGMG